jgi:murein L,D-transpeptidase YafK
MKILRGKVSILNGPGELTLRRNTSVIKEMKATRQQLLGALALLLTLIFPLISHSTEMVEPEENKIGGVEKIDPSVDKRPDPEAVQPPANQFPAAFSFIELGSYYSPYAFLADKSTRTLSVWKFTPEGPVFIEAHPIDLGKIAGDKEVLGDRKTPEGIYFFQQSYEGNRINFEEYGSHAFTTNYPNFFDQMKKKTGSGIWLHAIPESKSLLRGSRGCVVVRDKIIQHLSKYIVLQKTPIIVVNKAEYKPLANFKETRGRWQAWLDKWKSAWESKSIADYISNYHSAFNSQGMNKEAWAQFKSDLNSKYEYIKVKIEEPLIFVHNDEAIVRFLQSYESDKNSDFGEKYLYLKKENGEFKIVGETWSALSADLLAQKELKGKSPSN